MINILRKNQKGLWSVIAILCIPFVFYFVQKPDYGAAFHSEQFGKIYDRPITLLEFQHNARTSCNSRDSAWSATCRSSSGMRASKIDAYVRIHLQPPRSAARSGAARDQADQSADRRGGENLAAVPGRKRFRHQQIQRIHAIDSASMGFNETQLEELAADQLTMDRMKELVGKRRAGFGIGNERELRSRLRETRCFGRARA